jgi:small conductance mechanosensitive channel
MEMIEQYLDPEVLSVYAIEYGQALVFALAIFVIGKWVASRLTNMLKKGLKRGNMDETLVSFLGNIVKTILLAFVVIAALSQLGVETTSLAAVIAAAGLAIGRALQGSLANFAAGVMIIAFRPFKKGDFIEAGGVSGVVEEVNIFNTVFKTGDNKKVIVPNSAVGGGAITNYSANDTRRIDFVFGIGYDDDIRQAKSILESVLAADSRVLKDPAPTIGVLELADSSVNLACRPWVNTADYWGAYFDIMEEVKTRFDAEGISIPFPQQDVHMHAVELASSKQAA